MDNEVAIAFGLPPESLEPIEDDDQLSGGYCSTCADWARRFLDIERELADCRCEAAQYQNQIEALLALLPPVIAR